MNLRLKKWNRKWLKHTHRRLIGEGAQKFKDYFDWSEPIRKIPSHRLLAMRRAENEGIISLDIFPSEQQKVRVTVMEVDVLRKRIALSPKSNPFGTSLPKPRASPRRGQVIHKIQRTGKNRMLARLE